MLPCNPSILKRDFAFLSVACSMTRGRWSSSHETDAHLQSGWADQIVSNLPGRAHLNRRTIKRSIVYKSLCRGLSHDRPWYHVRVNACTIGFYACNEHCLHVSDSTQNLGAVTNITLVVLVPNDHHYRKVLRRTGRHRVGPQDNATQPNLWNGPS